MLPAKPFYLIRHGQSEANVARVACGSIDSPLTALGRSQAETLAPYLTQLEQPPVAVYHSDLSRARDTAVILNQTLKLPIYPRQDLREHHFGEWEGLPWPEVEPHLERGESPPGGESHSIFAQRIQSALSDIMAKAPGIPMIIAHGGLFHAIGFMYEYAMSEVQNCHLHYFEPNSDGGVFPWRVWRFDMDGAQLLKVPAAFGVS